MRILGTGLDGLVGSRIVEFLSDKYEFENLSISTGVDITDRNTVLEKIKNSDAQIVLHLAAKTNVDDCELDKPLGENSDAWKINVYGTQNVVDGCLQSKKKLIYISTDFVFDGENSPAGGYSEEDIPNPLNWYGKTKYEGEKIVQTSKIPWIIVRIASPYRATFGKLDFCRAILKRLQMGESLAGVTDHIFTPTFIDDIANGIDVLLKKEVTGLFHMAGSQALSPFEAVIEIAKVFNYDLKTITKTSRAEFFKDRAPRPFQLALKNDKIEKLGIRMRGFEEGIKEVKKQMRR